MSYVLAHTCLCLNVIVRMHIYIYIFFLFIYLCIYLFIFLYLFRECRFYFLIVDALSCRKHFWSSSLRRALEASMEGF